MTADEWKIIFFAALVFILFNIIMWSFIAMKNKFSTSAPKNSDNKEAFLIDPDFEIIENIIIVHTDEIIK